MRHPISLKTGEKLFKFMAGLILDKFHGTVAIRFEAGNVTHVETESRRVLQYKYLPEAVVARERSSQSVQQFVALGVQPGGVLLIHSAFSRVKPVEGAPRGLITALRGP